MLTSIIVSTYNQPDMLKLVLTALNDQHDKNFEVIVADDGSTAETANMLADLSGSLSYTLKHVWQEDVGFRAGTIRNKAVAASQGTYLIFLDGDCVPFASFIERHMSLKEDGWFVRGNRSMLSKEFTEIVLDESLPIHRYSKFTWLKRRMNKSIKRLLPLLHLPIGWYRKSKPIDWHGVKTCNLGLWRKDFELVNGFDERYIGWGREDADLAVRLFNNGIRRKEGICATCVLHLWHPESDRGQLEANDTLLEQQIINKTKRAEDGYTNHLQKSL
jgi:glycosyltransferase involved in cell wall biosynthesis